tara:strand:+ start:680 stop:817 length:138 start_codon:yes stop_codon:yes gene_type:complete
MRKDVELGEDVMYKGEEDRKSLQKADYKIVQQLFISFDLSTNTFD